MLLGKAFSRKEVQRSKGAKHLLLELKSPLLLGPLAPLLEKEAKGQIVQ